MVEAIKQYKDSVSGRIYDNEYDAIKSELKSTDIENAFDFVQAIPCFNTTDFVNGQFCIQHDATFYHRLLDTIISMSLKYHPSLNSAQLTREYIKGQSYLGRFLSESNSQISKWFDVQMSICPVCYREYGQLYYALNCEHNDSIPTLE